MSMIRMSGNIIAALGLLCGVLLLLSPLNAVVAWGLLLSGKTMALGILFVLLSWLGLMMGGIGDGGKLAADRLLFLMGAAWLVLGVLAIVALILDLVGLIDAGATLIWWMIAAAGTIAGAMAMTMGSDARNPRGEHGRSPTN